MNKTLPAIFATAFMLTCGATCYAAVSAAQVKKTIQQTCTQADNAAERKDVSGATNYIADPALKAKVSQRISYLVNTMESCDFLTRVVSVDLAPRKPNEAVVVITEHFQGLMRLANTGNAAVAMSDSKIRQFWVKRGSHWMMLKQRVLTHKMTLNGKPVTSW